MSVGYFLGAPRTPAQPPRYQYRVWPPPGEFLQPGPTAAPKRAPACPRISPRAPRIVGFSDEHAASFAIRTRPARPHPCAPRTLTACSLLGSATKRCDSKKNTAIAHALSTGTGTQRATRDRPTLRL